MTTQICNVAVAGDKCTLRFTGLASNTNYRVYLLARDRHANVQPAFTQVWRFACSVVYVHAWQRRSGQLACILFASEIRYSEKEETVAFSFELLDLFVAFYDDGGIEAVRTNFLTWFACCNVKCTCLAALTGPCLTLSLHLACLSISLHLAWCAG